MMLGKIVKGVALSLIAYILFRFWGGFVAFLLPVTDYALHIIPFVDEHFILQFLVRHIISAVIFWAGVYMVGSLNLAPIATRVVKWFAKNKYKELTKQSSYPIICVRVRNFLGGRPVGIATAYYGDDKKNYYNVLFININGFIALPLVPEQDVAREDRLTVLDVVLISFLGGFYVPGKYRTLPSQPSHEQS